MLTCKECVAFAEVLMQFSPGALSDIAINSFRY